MLKASLGVVRNESSGKYIIGRQSSFKSWTYGKVGLTESRSNVALSLLMSLVSLSASNPFATQSFELGDFIPVLKSNDVDT